MLRMLILLLAPALVWAGPLSESDRMAIRDVITAQMDAFRVDDAQRAFDLASPAIQAKSGSPDRFLDMVRKSYAPVYRPRAVFFQNITMMHGVPAQRVLVLDSSGAPVLAVYPMQRQPDGSWRINGCMLYKDRAQLL